MDWTAGTRVAQAASLSSTSARPRRAASSGLAVVVRTMRAGGLASAKTSSLDPIREWDTLNNTSSILIRLEIEFHNSKTLNLTSAKAAIRLARSHAWRDSMIQLSGMSGRMVDAEGIEPSTCRLRV